MHVLLKFSCSEIFLKTHITLIAPFTLLSAPDSSNNYKELVYICVIALWYHLASPFSFVLLLFLQSHSNKFYVKFWILFDFLSHESRKLPAIEINGWYERGWSNKKIQICCWIYGNNTTGSLLAIDRVFVEDLENLCLQDSLVMHMIEIYENNIWYLLGKTVLESETCGFKSQLSCLLVQQQEVWWNSLSCRLLTLHKIFMRIM